MTAASPCNIAIVVLAAGMARRMGEGGPHKLLAAFDGVPLVRLMVARALAASAGRVTVVSGHRADEIADALSGLPVEVVFNPDYAEGMSGSLKAGLAVAVESDPHGVLVLLADMPAVTVAHLDALIGAFRAADGQAVVRAVSGGKPGNPVILPRPLFAVLKTLEGDVGARIAIERSGLAVIDVEIGPAAHVDVDTVDAVVAAGGIPGD